MRTETRAPRQEVPASIRLAAHVRRVVESAPPLTEAQADRIAALLNGGAK